MSFHLCLELTNFIAHQSRTQYSIITSSTTIACIIYFLSIMNRNIVLGTVSTGLFLILIGLAFQQQPDSSSQQSVSTSETSEIVTRSPSGLS